MADLIRGAAPLILNLLGLRNAGLHGFAAHNGSADFGGVLVVCVAAFFQARLLQGQQGDGHLALDVAQLHQLGLALDGAEHLLGAAQGGVDGLLGGLVAADAFQGSLSGQFLLSLRGAAQLLVDGGLGGLVSGQLFERPVGKQAALGGGGLVDGGAVFEGQGRGGRGVFLRLHCGRDVGR